MRLILEADEENLHIAVRAAKSLHAAGYKECVYVYGEDDGFKQIVFYAKRNKSSISSRQIEPKMKDGKAQDKTS